MSIFNAAVWDNLCCFGRGYLYQRQRYAGALGWCTYYITKGERHKIVAGPHRKKLRYICMDMSLSMKRRTLKGLRFLSFMRPDIPFRRKAMCGICLICFIKWVLCGKIAKNEALENIVKAYSYKNLPWFYKGRQRERIWEKSAFGGVTVYKITRYIDSNIYDVKSVKIASALGFTENYISHTFKTNMEISLSAYIKKTGAALGLIENKVVCPLPILPSFAVWFGTELQPCIQAGIRYDARHSIKAEKQQIREVKQFYHHLPKIEKTLKQINRTCRSAWLRQIRTLYSILLP